MSAKMTLDCPACGQTIVDADPYEWSKTMSPEQFGENLSRLISAHDDTCKPRKAKPSPEDAKRRRKWWAVEIGYVVMWVAFAAINWVASGFPAGLAWLTGAAVFTIKMNEKITVFQRGYLRGQAEARVHLPMLSVINVHPADRWRRPKEWDEAEESS